jgi:hypothetical protein
MTRQLPTPSQTYKCLSADPKPAPGERERQPPEMSSSSSQTTVANGTLRSPALDLEIGPLHMTIVNNIRGFGLLGGGDWTVAKIIKSHSDALAVRQTRAAAIGQVRTDIRQSANRAQLLVTPSLSDDEIKAVYKAFNQRGSVIQHHVSSLYKNKPDSADAQNGLIAALDSAYDNLLKPMF